ncbi:MAG: TusE/DsrC/DsvC family sulfur relay protein [Hyphomicrobiaceae bacterium]
MSDIDINKLIQSGVANGLTGDPSQAARAAEVANWTEAKAKALAAADGLELTAPHLKAIRLLQDLYVAHGRAPHARMVSSELNDAFAAEGGSRYLYQLFPGGPVGQGSRLAGVPAPHDTKDLSFGSTY